MYYDNMKICLTYISGFDVSIFSYNLHNKILTIISYFIVREQVIFVKSYLYKRKPVSSWGDLLYTLSFLYLYVYLYHSASSFIFLRTSSTLYGFVTNFFAPIFKALITLFCCPAAVIMITLASGL